MKDIREELEQYLRIVWSEEDLIELRPLPSEQGTREWIRAIELLDSPRLDRLLAENQAGANIYAGVLPRTRIGGGSAKDIAGGRVVWADYDHVTPEDAIVRSAEKGAPPPSMVVNTGHGAHLFWRLESYTPAEEINMFLKRFVTFIGADSAATDVARILRLPGFRNTKDMSEEVYASVVYAEENCVYALNELKAVVPDGYKIETKISAATELKKTISWDYNPDQQIRRARAYVNAIPGTSKGGRNNATYRVAAALVNDYALDDSYALEILTVWDGSRNNPPIQSESNTELARLIESARKFCTRDTGNKLVEENVEDIQLPRAFSNTVIEEDEPEVTSESKKQGRPKSYEVALRPFMKPGGTLQMICDYIDAGARFYQPELSLGAALVFMGGIVGRLVTDPERTRTNLYVIGIAGSGKGKNRVLEAIPEIADATGIMDLLGPEGFKSGSALLKKISKNTKFVSFVDEMGEYLKALQTGGKQSHHIQEVNKLFLELYSKSNGYLNPPAAAGYEVKTVYDPFFGMYGCTVPESLFSGLSIEAVTNGFLPRTFLIEGRNNPERQKTNFDFPLYGIVSDIDYWGRVKMELQGIGNVADIKQEMGKPDLKLYEYEYGVEDYYYEKGLEYSGRGDEAGYPWDSLWTRTLEKGMRVALIHACSLKTGVVTFESAKYGCGFSEALTVLAEDRLKGNLYENENERNIQRVLKAIQMSKNGRILHGKLTAKTRFLKGYERKNIIESLIEEEVICSEQDGRKVYYRAIL